MMTRTGLSIFLVLTCTAVASAQRPPDPGSYDMEWVEFSTGQINDLTGGTRQVVVTAATGAVCPPTSTVVLTDPGGGVVWCFRPDGSIDQSSGAIGDGDVFAPNPTGGFDGFHLQGQRARAQAPLFLAIGRRVAAAPPPPPPPTGSLRVFITQPRASATVAGTVWVVLWVEGTSGTSNVFTLSADGRQVGSQTTGARGPVTLPWNTTTTPNGAHTLTATVRDAGGNSGVLNVSVLVRN
jgi:hypothetical protein